MTASQARLHVGGEAAIPLRSSQPSVDWGVSLRGPLLPQYPAATASSLLVSIRGMCPTGGGGGYLGLAVHARKARIQRSSPCVCLYRRWPRSNQWQSHQPEAGGFVQAPVLRFQDDNGRRDDLAAITTVKTRSNLCYPPSANCG